MLEEEAVVVEAVTFSSKEGVLDSSLSEAVEEEYLILFVDSGEVEWLTFEGVQEREDNDREVKEVSSKPVRSHLRQVRVLVEEEEEYLNEILNGVDVISNSDGLTKLNGISILIWVEKKVVGLLQVRENVF